MTDWIENAAKECAERVLIGAGSPTFAEIINRHFRGAVMIDKHKTVEQMCRDLLEQAVKDDLVYHKRGHQPPDAITGMANMLAGFLRQEHAEAGKPIVASEDEQSRPLSGEDASGANRCSAQAAAHTNIVEWENRAKSAERTVKSIASVLKAQAANATACPGLHLTDEGDVREVLKRAGYAFDAYGHDILAAARTAQERGLPAQPQGKPRCETCNKEMSPICRDCVEWAVESTGSPVKRVWPTDEEALRLCLERTTWPARHMSRIIQEIAAAARELQDAKDY